MMRVLVFLIFVVRANACISKTMAVQCFYSVADTNNDGIVTKKELTTAITAHLPWWQVKAFDFFGGTDKILQDCDADKDGTLTASEAMEMTDTCLENCFKRTATAHVFDC